MTERQVRVASKALRGEIEQGVKDANKGLVHRFNARLHRIHWVVLLVMVILGWPIDAALNAILHGLNFIPGAGWLVDTLMGPIDAFLVVVVPSTGFKELARRFWIRSRDKRWFRWIDEKLFGGGPDLLESNDTDTE